MGRGYFCTMSKVTSSSGLPTTSGYGYLYSFGIDKYICQLLFRYNGSIIDTLFTRAYTDHVWTAWTKISLSKI